MSDLAAELDEFALRIILESPYGPEWVRQAVKRDELAGLLLDLRKRGLSDRLVAEAWWAGDLPTARNMDGLTSAQIAEVNAAHKARA